MFVHSLVHISRKISLPISSLFPFLYFMVRDFHIADREENISYYAGYVGSSFMLGRALTSIPWGMIADRYGRKPVIVIGAITGYFQCTVWPKYELLDGHRYEVSPRELVWNNWHYEGICF